MRILPRNVLLMTVSLDFLVPPRQVCSELRNHDKNSTLSPTDTNRNADKLTTFQNHIEVPVISLTFSIGQAKIHGKTV